MISRDVWKVCLRVCRRRRRRRIFSWLDLKVMILFVAVEKEEIKTAAP